MRFCSEIILGAAVATATIGAALCAENISTAQPGVTDEAPRVVSVVRIDPRTGRLVRRMVVSGSIQPAAKPDPAIHATIEETAKNLNVNPQLVDSVIQVESNYDPLAVSPKGAQGLMQLMPATARRFGVTNSFDPRQNIEAGVRYLKFLQDTFQDDRLAIAAYNAGEKAVAKYKDVPPYAETINYVAKVGSKYGQAKRAAEKGKIEAKAVEQLKPAEDEPRHVVAYLDQDGRLHIATRQE